MATTTSQFDNVFSNLKAETLRTVMRDLGQKNLGQGGRRTEMIGYLKNAVFGMYEWVTFSSMNLILLS